MTQNSASKELSLVRGWRLEEIFPYNRPPTLEDYESAHWAVPENFQVCYLFFIYPLVIPNRRWSRQFFLIQSILRCVQKKLDCHRWTDRPFCFSVDHSNKVPRNQYEPPSQSTLSMDDKDIMNRSSTASYSLK